MNVPLWIINQFVCFAFDKVSTAIRITADMLIKQEYDRQHFFLIFEYRACADSGSKGHKNVLNIVSLSHCLEQLYFCIFNSYVKACLNIWWRRMYGQNFFFCLLSVGVCIDAYVMIGSYDLCVSTH